MSRVFLVMSALAGLLAVMAGAFGSHALRGQLDADALRVFDIAVRYQMYHALALMLLSLLLRQAPLNRWLRAAGACFVLGMLLFCGSLYLLALVHVTALGIVTPFGGLVLMLGWAFLATGSWKLSR